MWGQAGGRKRGDLCSSVTHAPLGLMLMENWMFKKNLSRKKMFSLNPLLLGQCDYIITKVKYENAGNEANMSHFQQNVHGTFTPSSNS